MVLFFKRGIRIKIGVFFLLKVKVIYVDVVESGFIVVYMLEDDDVGDIFCVRVGNLLVKMVVKLIFFYV